MWRRSLCGVAGDCCRSAVGRPLRRGVRLASNSRRRPVCSGLRTACRSWSIRSGFTQVSAAPSKRRRWARPRPGARATTVALTSIWKWRCRRFPAPAARNDGINAVVFRNHQLVPDEQRRLHARLRSGRRLGGDGDRHNEHRTDHRRRRRDQRRRFQLGRSPRLSPRAIMICKRLDRGLRPSHRARRPLLPVVAGCDSPARQHRQPVVDCDQASAAVQAETMFPAWPPATPRNGRWHPRIQAAVCGIYPLAMNPRSCQAGAGPATAPPATPPPTDGPAYDDGGPPDQQRRRRDRRQRPRCFGEGDRPGGGIRMRLLQSRPPAPHRSLAPRCRRHGVTDGVARDVLDRMERVEMTARGPRIALGCLALVAILASLGGLGGSSGSGEGRSARRARRSLRRPPFGIVNESWDGVASRRGTSRRGSCSGLEPSIAFTTRKLPVMSRRSTSPSSPSRTEPSSSRRKVVQCLGWIWRPGACGPPSHRAFVSKVASATPMTKELPVDRPECRDGSSDGYFFPCGMAGLRRTGGALAQPSRREEVPVGRAVATLRAVDREVLRHGCCGGDLETRPGELEARTSRTPDPSRTLNHLPS